MVENTKTWISWEQNITFLRNKKSPLSVPQITHFEKLLFVAEMNFKDIFYSHDTAVKFIFASILWQFFMQVNVKYLDFNWLSLWNYFFIIYLVCVNQMAEQLFENGFPLANTLNVSKKLYEYNMQDS